MDSHRFIASAPMIGAPLGAVLGLVLNQSDFTVGFAFGIATCMTVLWLGSRSAAEVLQEMADKITARTMLHVKELSAKQGKDDAPPQ